MQRVFVCSVEGLAGFIAQIGGVYRIFGEIRTEAPMGDDGALQIVVAIHAHRVSVHRPVVCDTAMVGCFHAINCCASPGALANARCITGSALFKSKLFPTSKPIFFSWAMIGWSVTWGGLILRSSAA